MKIHPRFQHLQIDAEQKKDMADVRIEATSLLELIEAVTFPCREQSLALTKLEEAVMWANKAISGRDANFER